MPPACYQHANGERKPLLTNASAARHEEPRRKKAKTMSTKKATKNPWILADYSAAHLYTGREEYHARATTRGENAPIYKDGEEMEKFLVGVELETVARNEHHFREVNKPESNWLFRERDGSLPPRGIEFITIPLRPKHAKSEKFWRPICEELNKACKSWCFPQCGLHVHVGKGAFEGVTWEEREAAIDWAMVVWSLTCETSEFVARIFGRGKTYCQNKIGGEKMQAVKTLGAKILTTKELRKEILKECQDFRARTAQLNTMRTTTVEFRLGKGSIRPERISGIVEFCLLFIQFAAHCPPVRATEKNLEAYIRAHAMKEGGLAALIRDEETAPLQNP